MGLACWPVVMMFTFSRKAGNIWCWTETDDMIYCEAIFPRGAGLGTRLFPWARCVIFSHVNRVPMLASQWVQPRVGPLLRGGIDLRAYHRQILLLGLFKPKSDNVVGLKRIMLRCLADRVSEPQRIDASYIAKNSPRNKVISLMLSVL